MAPAALTIDPAGNIYIANLVSNNVSKITPLGVSTIFGTTGMSPYAITIDHAGNIYTANYDNHNVSIIPPHGATDTTGNINLPSTSTDNTITLVDLTPPLITLIGSASITISQGSTYTDSGASWSDNVDGTGNTLS